MCWPRKHSLLKQWFREWRDRSPPAAPAVLLDGALGEGEGEVAGVNAWLQADRGWQRPGYFPHSSGPSILVAQEMDIYFL